MAIGVLRVDNDLKHYLTNGDDKPYLANGKLAESLSSECNARNSPNCKSNNKHAHTRVAQFSAAIGRNIQNMVQNRKIPQETELDRRGNNEQNPPSPPLSNGAYQNFLVLEDQLNQSRRQKEPYRNHCTGILRLSGDLPQLNDNSERRNSSLQFHQHNEKFTLWRKLHLLTNVFKHLRRSRTNTSSSPSGTLLPSNLPNAIAIESSTNEPSQRTQKSFQELRDDAMQKIQKYIYFGQGLLIAIIALIWVASYVFVMKSSHILSDNQTIAQNGNKPFKNTTADTYDKPFTNSSIAVAYEKNNSAVKKNKWISNLKNFRKAKKISEKIMKKKVDDLTFNENNNNI